MKSEKDIHGEVEKTMQSLDGIKRASTDDYFYSRLQARMESRKETEPRLTWGIAAAIVIILMNVLSVIYYADSSIPANEISQEELSAFAETYALTVPRIYEQNSEE